MYAMVDFDEKMSEICSDVYSQNSNFKNGIYVVSDIKIYFLNILCQYEKCAFLMKVLGWRTFERKNLHNIYIFMVAKNGNTER